MKTISSSFTFLYKYLFTFVWIVIGGIVTAVVSISDGKTWFSYIWIALWPLSSVFVYLKCFKLLRIEMDDDNLYLSNYWKKVTINASDISKISQLSYLKSELISLELKNRCEFGEKILFMPRTRIIQRGKHPIVYELKKASKNQL